MRLKLIIDLTATSVLMYCIQRPIKIPEMCILLHSNLKKATCETSYAVLCLSVCVSSDLLYFLRNYNFLTNDMAI